MNGNLTTAVNLAETQVQTDSYHIKCHLTRPRPRLYDKIAFLNRRDIKLLTASPANQSFLDNEHENPN